MNGFMHQVKGQVKDIQSRAPPEINLQFRPPPYEDDSECATLVVGRLACKLKLKSSLRTLRDGKAKNIVMIEYVHPESGNTYQTSSVSEVARVGLTFTLTKSHPTFLKAMFVYFDGKWITLQNAINMMKVDENGCPPNCDHLLCIMAPNYYLHGVYTSNKSYR